MNTNSSGVTPAQIEQATLTGCGICSSVFCEHGFCRVCTGCPQCGADNASGDVMPVAIGRGDVVDNPINHDNKSTRDEAARLHEKAEQRRNDFKLAVDELASAVCVCGHSKCRRQSLCKHCYKSLPQDVKHGLYLGMFSGYLEFRRKAHELLRKSGRMSAKPFRMPTFDEQGPRNEPPHAESFIAEAREFIRNGMAAPSAVARSMANYCILRCASCKRSIEITQTDIEHSIEHGWPVCCGATMGCHFKEDKVGA
jgi:hypothetical protein